MKKDKQIDKQKELEDQKEIMTAMFNSLDDMMLLIAPDYTVIDINQYGLDLLELIRGDVVGKKCFEIIHKTKKPIRECPLKITRKDNLPAEISRYEKELGRYFSVKTTPVINAEGKVIAYVDLKRDETETVMTSQRLQEANKRLQEASITDELTGLYNRRYLYEILESEIDRMRRHKRDLSVVMFDIDCFKDYNDNYGHLEGDKVLKRFGRLLKDNTRKSDISCRYGGEEFVLLLPETRKNEAYTISDKIRRLFSEEPFSIGSEIVYCTISGGISQLRDEYLPEAFLKSADARLYKAKEEGRNQII
jgi:diguanylate cyclase (GGDEF)-like protein